jgi:hypothetical protein
MGMLNILPDTYWADVGAPCYHCVAHQTEGFLRYLSLCGSVGTRTVPPAIDADDGVHEHRLCKRCKRIYDSRMKKATQANG